MSNVLSRVAYWVSQYNAVVASLATRTSERDTARNGLYVSGVYQSGATWQQQDAVDLSNYNNEVAAYNGMVSSRDTWVGRANQAWGFSRVWNSGESFEALQSRILGAVGTPFQTAVTGFNNHGGGLQTHPVGGQTTVPKNGQYAIFYLEDSSHRGVNNDPSADNQHRRVVISIAGSPIIDEQNGTNAVFTGSLTGGQNVSFQSEFPGGFGDTGGVIWWLFLPTSSNPS